jgi:hypothetical protein
MEIFIAVRNSMRKRATWNAIVKIADLDRIEASMILFLR